MNQVPNRVAEDQVFVCVCVCVCMCVCVCVCERERGRGSLQADRGEGLLGYWSDMLFSL